MSACPICASPSLTPYVTVDSWRIARCGSCQSFALDPMPSEAELTAYYTDLYEGARAGYFAKVDKKMKRARGRMRRLKRFAPGGRFLDIGCNGGFMVEAAREVGLTAVGIDLDPVSIDYARTHYGSNTFHHGRIEDLANSEAPFDLVYASEVIEHVTDPNGFAAALFGLTKPGGHAFLTTPDAGHWSLPRDLRDARFFMPPEHTLYFNAGSLRGLLERAGFAYVSRRLALKPGIKMLVRRPY